MLQLFKNLFSGAKKMNITQIADHYFVSPQISIEEVAAAKAQGFQTIVCNRPDNEEPNQVNSDKVAAACAEHGLDFVFLPMQGPAFGPEYLPQVQALVNDKKKVLAYCRSGNRSSILFNAAMNG